MWKNSDRYLIRFHRKAFLSPHVSQMLFYQAWQIATQIAVETSQFYGFISITHCKCVLHLVKLYLQYILSKDIMHSNA